MAALTLVEHGVPVTMLESGLSQPRGLLVRVAGRNVIRARPRIEDPKCHVASDDPSASWYHSLTVGGMSSHWAGAVPRFAPDDFTEGERLDERYRWPIVYDDLVPYYDRVERLLRVTGAQHGVVTQPANVVAHERRLPSDWDGVVQRAEAQGHGLTLLPLAAGPRWALRDIGVGFSSYAHIVRPLEQSPHFRLVRGAHALRLNWRGDQRGVDSVTYFDRLSSSERRIRGAAVVVAAGALASAKLLLQSSSPDFPEGLGDSEGLLGHYLHDHPYDVGTIELRKPLTGLRQSAVLTRASYAGAPPLQAAACVLGSNSSWEKVRTVTPFGSRRFGMWIFGTMTPLHHNYVQLDPNTKDAFGLPALDVHIRYDHQVYRNVTEARQRLAAIFDAAGYPCSIHSSTPTLVPGTSIHYGGTIRMHRSSKYGMANAWNRLHAVDNVVVADASCFTTGPEKNPTLTVMAIAARAADRLAADLKSGSLATRPRSLTAVGV